MSTGLRSRLAALVLAFVLVWPPIQHVLARAFDASPWAFFGFAMYTVPNLRVNVRAAPFDARASEPPDWNRTPRGARDLLRAYAQRRVHYGELLPPDALADAILAADPSLPGVAVRVRRWELDRASARLARRDRDRFYEREPAN